MTSVTLSSGQRWQLGEEVGSGGSGRVYVVTSEASEPHVVKLVPKTPGALRELLVVNDLQGRANVIPVLDTGETDTHWALLMPQADMSLRQYIYDAQGPIPEIKALPILMDIARAIAALTGAREAGLAAKAIVHRDLKPENVLYWNGTWCLSDFGVARYLDSGTAPDTRRYFMTPGYAAPEQWRGETATSSTEVYAFGLIAFELLMGRPPFEGPDLRQQHLDSKVPPISGISPTLAAIIAECLYKHAGTRPSPHRLMTRLKGETDRAGSEQAGQVTAGMSALQAANLTETTRRGQSAWQAQQGGEFVELRTELLSVATEQWKQMKNILKSTILEYAPTCHVDKVGDRGWQLQLNKAAIVLSGLRKQEYLQSLRFDVIAHCYIAVGLVNDDYHRFYNRYSGRAHSLWFCDAETKGQFFWYEVGFRERLYSNSPVGYPGYLWRDTGTGLGTASGSYIPVAALPGEAAKDSELNPRHAPDNYFGITWPLTPVITGELGDFVDRWATWFAGASIGNLSLKIQGVDYAERPAPEPPGRRARGL